MIDTRLEKIKKITPSQLGEAGMLDLLNRLTNEYVVGSQVGEADELWQALRRLTAGPQAKTINAAVIDQINRLMVDLGWLALPFLSDSAVEDLFRANLLRAFSLEVDVLGKIKTLFSLSYGDLNALEQQRRLLLGALKANETLIGDRPIKISDAGQELTPAIKNWLKDYDQSSNSAQRSRRLNLVEYINTNNNVRQLSVEQKETLRWVLGVYDFIRFLNQRKGMSETGHEVPAERVAVLTHEEPVSAAVQEPVSEGEEEILQAYQGDSKQQQAIVHEQAKLAKKIGGSPRYARHAPRAERAGGAGKIDQLPAIFYRAVQTKNVAATVAALLLMAETDTLVNFLQADEKLRQFLSLTWEKQYGKAVADEFGRNPNQPKFVRLFLQYVLQQRLGLDSSEAARLGLHVGSTFVRAGKKEYNTLAYFDVTSKTFKWFDG